MPDGCATDTVSVRPHSSQATSRGLLGNQTGSAASGEESRLGGVGSFVGQDY
jgi:hypothetical protein